MLSFDRLSALGEDPRELLDGAGDLHVSVAEPVAAVISHLVNVPGHEAGDVAPKTHADLFHH